MIKTLLYVAILILAAVSMAGCGSDPSGAAGMPQDEGTQSNGPSDAAHAGGSQNLPSPPQTGVPHEVPGSPGAPHQGPGSPVMGTGGMGNAGGALDQPGSGGSAASQPATWQSYTSPQFNFSISYPDLYLVSDQGDLPQDVPNLVHRVRFLDKVLAASPTANLQPPQFMIDVFENKESMVLEDWIAANERRGTPTEVTIGNQSGYLVSLQTMQAPNQFYFVSHGQHIYRLIPLGQHAAEMLRSFKLG
jgi:hypothetical protein